MPDSNGLVVHPGLDDVDERALEEAAPFEVDRLKLGEELAQLPRERLVDAF